jgi:segregation and condensation protein B
MDTPVTEESTAPEEVAPEETVPEDVLPEEEPPVVAMPVADAQLNTVPTETPAAEESTPALEQVAPEETVPEDVLPQEEPPDVTVPVANAELNTVPMETPATESSTPAPEEVEAEEVLPEEEQPDVTMPVADAELKAVLEAIIYVTDEPLTLDQICAGLEQPRDRVLDLLEQLAADYEQSSRGLTIKEIAGGFKMATKAEHHEAVRRFVKNLNPPLKLSLPALETLAVIAYKQPITAPEIMEIRGVQGASVLKTLIDRKLIATSGRKQVVGKPILYKTTREFLVQFGLKDLAELPTLKEFQEIGRLDNEADAPAETQHTPAPSEPLLFPAQPDEPVKEEVQ